MDKKGLKYSLIVTEGKDKSIILCDSENEAAEAVIVYCDNCLGDSPTSLGRAKNVYMYSNGTLSKL